MVGRWQDRLSYDDENEGPLVALHDFDGNVKAYAFNNTKNTICERYNRGLPEPPLDENALGNS